MVPLLICSVIALAIILDRWLAFRANNRVDARALRARLLQLLHEGKVADALNHCASTPGPISAVLLAGLQTYEGLDGDDRNTNSIRLMVGKSMEDFSRHAMSAVEKRLNGLSTIGNAAPLLGMTGTVTGMIASFGALAGAGQLDAAVVAGGISEALITTASGLMIALFAVIPYNFFTSKAESIELEIDEATTEIVEFLATHRP